MKVKCVQSHYNVVHEGEIYNVLHENSVGFTINLRHGKSPYWNYHAPKHIFEVVENDLQISINTANLSYAVDFLVQNANWWDGNNHKQVSDRLKNEIEKCYQSMKQQVETNNPFEYSLSVGGFTVIGWWDNFEERIGQIEILIDAGMNRTGVIVDVKELLEQL